jgi:bis(5'-nucleosyl)-tetraphosphatase (symmetrical)
MLDWLRSQRMAMREHGLLMVHGGVLPQWSADQVMGLAREVEAVVRGPNLTGFLLHMYGNEPDRWSDSLQGPDRLRVIVNALTRLRFCTADGAMHLKATGGPADAPAGTMPWFDVPGRRTADDTVAFGHWSTLGYVRRPDLISLDTGCVWGGCLSALRLSSDGEHELVQVKCEQSQAPGE